MRMSWHMMSENKLDLTFKSKSETPQIDHLKDDEEDLKEHIWSTIDGALVYKGRIYVPPNKELRLKVISISHDPPESGHFGTLRTAELVSRHFIGHTWIRR